MLSCYPNRPPRDLHAGPPRSLELRRGLGNKGRRISRWCLAWEVAMPDESVVEVKSEWKKDEE
jgi:hypothetical protein